MKTNSIAVLPLGAHEYHGQHLPFETDSLIAQAFAQHIAAALPANVQAEFLPVETITYSREHMRTKGSKSLSAAAAIEKWLHIAEQQHKKGIRKFIMLNTHGGNTPLLTIIATELRERFNMLAVAASFSRFDLPPGLLSKKEQALDIHGGFIETSVMLAIAPDTVDMSQAQNFTNAQTEYSKEFTLLRAYGLHSFGWIMQDINRLGAAGNALRATAAAGRKILAYKTAEAVKLFADVAKFDISKLQ